MAAPDWSIVLRIIRAEVDAFLPFAGVMAWHNTCTATRRDDMSTYTSSALRLIQVYFPCQPIPHVVHQMTLRACPLTDQRAEEVVQLHCMLRLYRSEGWLTNDPRAINRSGGDEPSPAWDECLDAVETYVLSFSEHQTVDDVLAAIEAVLAQLRSINEWWRTPPRLACFRPTEI